MGKWLVYEVCNNKRGRWQRNAGLLLLSLWNSVFEAGVDRDVRGCGGLMIMLRPGLGFGNGPRRGQGRATPLEL